MADHHPDDVAAVDAHGLAKRASRRALLDHMATLRAAIASAESAFRTARDEKHAATDAFVGVVRELHALRTPRPLDEWEESAGAVLWWTFPVTEPPYVGDPREDDFPDYLTHWTPIPVVQEPGRAHISEHGACPACLLGECREHDAQSPCDVFVHVRDAAAIRTRDCGGDGHHLCRTCAAFEEP